MKIAVVGTGYVGLVAGTCLAETGNRVVCVDVDEDKVRTLQQGQVPIFEPGLAEMVRRNVSEERLDFTTDLARAVEESLILFIAAAKPAVLAHRHHGHVRVVHRLPHRQRRRTSVRRHHDMCDAKLRLPSGNHLGHGLGIRRTGLVEINDFL